MFKERPLKNLNISTTFLKRLSYSVMLFNYKMTFLGLYRHFIAQNKKGIRKNTSNTREKNTTNSMSEITMNTVNQVIKKRFENISAMQTPDSSSVSQ